VVTNVDNRYQYEIAVQAGEVVLPWWVKGGMRLAGDLKACVLGDKAGTR
jgi:hypothetical protein